MRKLASFSITSIILLCASAPVFALNVTSSLDFGTVVVGSEDASRTLSVGNNGSQTLTFSSCSVSGGFSAPVGGFELQPGAQKVILVSLGSNQAPGVYNGAYRCNFDGGSFQTVLRGTVVDLISVNPTTLNFGNVTVQQTKSLELTIKNNLSPSLTSTVVVSLKTLSSAGQFVVSKSALQLKGGQATALPVTMNAGNAPGNKSDSLVINFGKIGSASRTINIPLTGTVITN